MNRPDFEMDSDLETARKIILDILSRLRWNPKKDEERTSADGTKLIVIISLFYNRGKIIGELKISSNQIFDWGSKRKRES